MKKNKILVSIIVPVYQAERYLEEAVDSIRGQSLDNIEILLIDDGSKDNSGEICDKLATQDSRIRVIHKENGGQSSARNIGIALAQGRYIGFMDNDDYMYPNLCEILYINAEKYQADISAGSYNVNNSKNILIHTEHSNRIYELDNPKGVEAYLSREVMDIYVWTKFYRKDFIENHQIRFEEGRSDEDLLFNHLAFLAAKKTVVQDIPLYLYFERTNSTYRTFSKNNLRKYIEDTCYRVRKIEKSIQENYPDLLRISKIQTIVACFRMLSILTHHQKIENEPYYNWIKDYLRENAEIVIKERKKFGMSFIGVLFAAYMPKSIYFIIKQWKHRNEK